MMQNLTANNQALMIYNAASPVIRIYGVGGKSWKRKVAKGSRIGPWLQGKYEILSEKVWRDESACLYMVSGSDSIIRYVGISRNGLKHRWRTSPAYDAETMTRLTENQLFHSQCWKHVERESLQNPNITFEVRSISAEQIMTIKESLPKQITALVDAFEGDGESIVAGIERWLCNHSTNQLVPWNVSMTGRKA